MDEIIIDIMEGGCKLNILIYYSLPREERDFVLMYCMKKVFRPLQILVQKIPKHHRLMHDPTRPSAPCGGYRIFLHFLHGRNPGFRYRVELLNNFRIHMFRAGIFEARRAL